VGVNHTGYARGMEKSLILSGERVRHDFSMVLGIKE